MAPPRPYWKGYLKLSLVSCPIALYSAVSSSERVAFRQINRKTGNRLRQQLIDDETHAVVESADKARGYEVDKGTYLLIEDAEMDEVAIESSHTIDIDTFVPRSQIDERFLESPYYLVPNDKVGQEAFAVIRDAMRGKDMVALGRVVISKRERVMMLQAWDKGLLGTALRYPYEVRETSAYFDDIEEVKIPKEMLSLAEHILESKRADFDPSQFKDRYEEALIEMIRRKQAHLPAQKAPARPAGKNVVDLMESLRRSLGPTPATASTKAPAGKAKGKKRVPGQAEMLLPIAGKGQGKEAVKKPTAKAASGRRKAG